MWHALFEWVRPVDEWLFRQINTQWGVPGWDGVMSVVSSFEVFKKPLAGLVVFLLVKGGFRERLALILMGLCLLFGDAGVNWAIKRSSNRPRPYEALNGVRQVEMGRVTWSQPGPVTNGNSFTSGHACNNVALAIVLTLVYGRWAAVWAWPWAMLVSYSRIYTGSHYPFDVCAAWIVASLYASAICGLAAWIWHHSGPRWLPQVWARHPQLFFS